MPTLTSDENVTASCLRILRARGWSLSRVLDQLEESPRGYRAEQGAFSFEARTALELLGLTALHDYVRPIDDEPRWWLLSGVDIESELLQSAHERALEGLRGRDPERWRRLVLDALDGADCNAAADEILGISRRELDRIQDDPLLAPR